MEMFNCRRFKKNQIDLCRDPVVFLQTGHSLLQKPAKAGTNGRQTGNSR